MWCGVGYGGISSGSKREFRAHFSHGIRYGLCAGFGLTPGELGVILGVRLGVS